MVIVSWDPGFEKSFRKIRDARLKERVIKHIAKIRETPDIGKPMRYGRKGTREVHVPPFRLSYFFDAPRGTLVLLDLYHKDEQ
jgi:mRNA-degrading endonuclease RelE of RelBE toxin-antitoxin system